MVRFLLHPVLYRYSEKHRSRLSSRSRCSERICIIHQTVHGAGLWIFHLKTSFFAIPWCYLINSVQTHKQSNSCKTSDLTRLKNSSASSMAYLNLISLSWSAKMAARRTSNSFNFDSNSSFKFCSSTAKSLSLCLLNSNLVLKSSEVYKAWKHEKRDCPLLEAWMSDKAARRRFPRQNM